MGQGQNKIALSLVDLQPTAIVELFELILDSVDKSSSPIRFHGGAIFQQDIKWKGNNYTPLPVESEGFEVTANGQMPRPKIRLSNKDYYVTDLLLNNNDLQFAKIIRRRTFVKYLDDINFDGGNPWGQADSSAELSVDTFVVSQKTAENKVFVELELSSPLDLENFEVNSRLLMSRYCSWYYRGNGCNYQGPPVETEYGLGLQLNTNSARELSTNGSAIFTTGAWNTGIAEPLVDNSLAELVFN
jgi:lambda family phage minor tail protein L